MDGSPSICLCIKVRVCCYGYRWRVCHLTMVHCTKHKWKTCSAHVRPTQRHTLKKLGG